MKSLLFLLCLLVFSLGNAQKMKQQRFKNFDKKAFRFGFMLGVNNTDFTVYQNPNAYEQFGLVSVKNESQPGGQLGILTSLKLGTPLLRLRFMPGLSFQERTLIYSSLDSSNFPKGESEERINSTCLDFPLSFVFRTKRFNNFAAYALFGGQYSIDLQSQQNASQNFIDPFIKLNRFDIQGQLGVGIDVFAPFFKFSIEVKYSHGVKSSFIQDFSPVAKPIDLLYNKGWWFSIIFQS
tara:strand:+ start:5288 stop:5998 length:711 start_codon:yes stop_codon:yes gene_type:complete